MFHTIVSIVYWVLGYCVFMWVLVFCLYTFTNVLRGEHPVIVPLAPFMPPYFVLEGWDDVCQKIWVWRVRRVSLFIVNQLRKNGITVRGEFGIRRRSATGPNDDYELEATGCYFLYDGCEVFADLKLSQVEAYRDIYATAINKFTWLTPKQICLGAYPKEPLPPSKARTLGVLETTILFSSINFLFAIFVLFQLSYLFGGTEHLLASGLTYAEYAKDGFSQLVWVAILSFLIISFAERAIVQHESGHTLRFKLLSGTLVALVIAILVSAFTRLSLYEEAYGFTVIRLYSHALMVWLAVALVLLSLHIVSGGRPAKFALRAFLSVIFMLFAVNILNPDAFIAKQNLARYQATGKLDAVYLGSLSDDALLYTIPLLDSPDEKVRDEFAHSLYLSHLSCKSDSLENEGCTLTGKRGEWKAMHLRSVDVEQLLNAHESFIEERKNG